MQFTMPSTRRTRCTIFHRWHECNVRCACDSGLSTDVLITLLWRISYLLICARLHEFALVPYIIINLPHKPRGAAFYLFTEWRQMMPNKPGLRAKCTCSILPDRGASPSPSNPTRTLSDHGAGSMISSAQLSRDLSCYRVPVGALSQAGACATHAAW